MIFDKLFSLIDHIAGWWLDKRVDQVVKNDPALEEFQLHRLEVTAGHQEITAISPAIACIADEAAGMLKSAENYISFDMMPRLDRGKRPVRVTVQWADGMSPARRATKLEEENRRIKHDAGWLFRKARTILNLINEFETVPEGQMLQGLEDSIRTMGERYPDILEWVETK